MLNRLVISVVTDINIVGEEAERFRDEEGRRALLKELSGYMRTKRWKHATISPNLPHTVDYD